MDILPIPSDLILYHAYFKLLCAGLGTILLVLLLDRYRIKKTRIALGFVLVFLCLILGNIFSSFDNLFNWENLLGPETWVGFGIGEICSTLASVGYFWIYIEVFKVKDRWTHQLKRYFAIFTIIELITAVLMFTYYAFHFPSVLYISTGINLGLTVMVYFLWIAGCSKLLKTIEEPQFRNRFLYLRKVAIVFLIVIVFLAMASISASPSFTSWIGMMLMIYGMYCGYKSILST